MNETPCPNQSRLNAGLRRSGVTSSANRDACRRQARFASATRGIIAAE
jgi:hypothetical protein